MRIDPGHGGRNCDHPPKVLFIGTGRAAQGLAHAFVNSGVHVLGMWSRTGREVAAFRTYSGGFGSELEQADCVLFCVPDHAIAKKANLLSKEKKRLVGKLAAHVSGSMEAAVLKPLEDAGARTASLHPFFSFTGKVDFTLSDIPFSVEGDPRAVEGIRKLFAPYGMHAAVLDAANRPLYHAAAVFCANFPAALQVAAETMLGLSGFAQEDINRMLGALLGSVAHNVRHGGPRAALTGPVVRRDLETIGKHFSVLSKSCPQMLPSYTVMTLLLASVSGAHGDRRFMSGLSDLVEKHLPGGMKLGTG